MLPALNAEDKVAEENRSQAVRPPSLIEVVDFAVSRKSQGLVGLLGIFRLELTVEVANDRGQSGVIEVRPIGLVERCSIKQAVVPFNELVA